MTWSNNLWTKVNVIHVPIFFPAKCCMMTIVTEHNLKPAAAVEATAQLFIYSGLFSIIETINSFFTHWNTQESCPITTTCSQGINYTDHLSVMWMSGPEGVTGKAGKKKQPPPHPNPAPRKQHTQWCTHMPRWSFLHVDKRVLTPRQSDAVLSPIYMAEH